MIVWRLDRRARSLPHLIDLAAEVDRRGIELRSLTENIDTSTAAGKLFFNRFASIAEFERNLIIERTHAGLDAARAQGKFGGRPPALDSRKKKLIDAAVRDAKRDGRQPSAKEIAFSIGTSENALSTMDGFAALMTHDFHDSEWTDQGVGFAFARRHRELLPCLVEIPTALWGNSNGFEQAGR